METQDFSFLKIETFLPRESLEPIIAAITDAGAGKYGNYDHVYTSSEVAGHWRPLQGASPAIGSIGVEESAPEIKIEFVCPREIVVDVVRAIKKVHPYETPVINLIPVYSFHFEEE